MDYIDWKVSSSTTQMIVENRFISNLKKDTNINDDIWMLLNRKSLYL